MTHPTQKSGNHLLRLNIAVPPPIVGIGVTVTLVLLGQHFFKDWISSFISWTAYFLLATFVGMFTSSILERLSFQRGNRQLKDLVLTSAGIICSLLALMLSDSKDAASSMLAVSACILFGSFLLLAKRRSGNGELSAQSPADPEWSFFLDSLLKLDLPPGLRSQIAGLLDLVWEAPADLPSFIPHQNYEIDSLLNKLDLAIRQNKIDDANRQIIVIHKKLLERNTLILQNVEIEYKKINASGFLPKKPNA